MSDQSVRVFKKKEGHYHSSIASRKLQLKYISSVWKVFRTIITEKKVPRQLTQFQIFLTTCSRITHQPAHLFISLSLNQDCFFPIKNEQSDVLYTVIEHVIFHIKHLKNYERKCYPSDLTLSNTKTLTHICR
mmetsp:Transcript_25453/g.36988  ORF Transcript_25453/g.36988 Transcript_25453/m.36988 type:complete len:132 (-) Transcript_25453:159-554(-)